MAANPVIIACPADTWVKVAEDVLVGTIYQRSTRPNVYAQTVRVTGDAAPTDDSDAVRIFEKIGESDISSDTPVDVYIKAITVAGEVSVAIGIGGKNNVIKSIIPGNIVISQDEHYFILEQAFTQSQRFNMAAAQVMWFVIDASNYSPGQTQKLNKVIFRVPSITAEAGPIHVDFYSGPTIGAATPTILTLPPFNRVAGSSIVPQTEFSSLNQAPDDLGSPISELLNPATATGVGNRTGSSTVESLPFAIDIPTPLLMAITNTNGADTDVGIRHGWFEI